MPRPPSPQVLPFSSSIHRMDRSAGATATASEQPTAKPPSPDTHECLIHRSVSTSSISPVPTTIQRDERDVGSRCADHWWCAHPGSEFTKTGNNATSKGTPSSRVRCADHWGCAHSGTEAMRSLSWDNVALGSRLSTRTNAGKVMGAPDVACDTRMSRIHQPRFNKVLCSENLRFQNPWCADSIFN